MRRRRVLEFFGLAATGGLAGCAGRGDGGDRTQEVTDTGTTTPTDTPTDTQTPTDTTTRSTTERPTADLLDFSEIDTWQENLDLPTQYNTNDEAYDVAKDLY